MKTFKLYIAIILMTTSISVSSQQSSGGNFSIVKHTIDGGGSTSQGGVFSLTGSIAQHDNNQTATGGQFSLDGGFWTKSQTTAPNDLIFYNGFETPP